MLKKFFLGKSLIFFFLRILGKFLLKISENFYFDLNDDSLREMISRHVARVDDTSKCTQALFSINRAISDVFIVIKV